MNSRMDLFERAPYSLMDEKSHTRVESRRGEDEETVSLVEEVQTHSALAVAAAHQSTNPHDVYVIDTDPLCERPHTPTSSHPSPHASPTHASHVAAALHATPPSGQRYLDLVLAEASEPAAVSAQASAAAYYEQQHAHTYNDTDLFPVPSSSTPAATVWTAGTVNGVSPPGEKPKRPLSAYNFFFQLERERIVDGHVDCANADAPVQAYSVQDVARVALLQQQKLQDPQPKEKRSHRKTHGKISFGDLARTIAQRWKRLDDTSRAIFDGSASLEKERYRRELAEWTKKQKKWKDAAAKLTHSMRQQTQLFPPMPHQPASYAAHYMNPHEDDCVVVTPSKSPRQAVAHTASPHARQNAIAAAMLSQQSVVRQDSPTTASSVHPSQSHLAHMRRQSSMNYSHAGHATTDRRFSTGMMPSSQYQTTSHHPYHQLPYVHSLDDDPHMDYDDVADETYTKAHRMLPLPEQQQQLRPSNDAYQAMLNQRRMRMMTMMQQRQRMNHSMNGMSSMSSMKQQAMMQQQQQMMRMMQQMNQTPSHDMDMFGGIEQSIQQQEQQRQVLMEQMAERSGHDGPSSDAAYIHQSSHHGDRFNGNHPSSGSEYFDTDAEPQRFHSPPDHSQQRSHSNSQQHAHSKLSEDDYTLSEGNAFV